MEMSKTSAQDETRRPVATNVATDRPAVVRYDAACSLCITLANFMGKRVSPEQIVFVASDHASPEKLEVDVPTKDGFAEPLAGERAWHWLLEHHPMLAEIGWAAQKLGITGLTSRSMMRSAEVLRRLCFRCRR